MAGRERHELVETARLHAKLSVSELWLSYVALGGTHDLFDVDAYLSGLAPLDAREQTVLAVAVNERLDEAYRAVRVPLATPACEAAPVGELHAVVAALLDYTGPDPTAGSAASDDRPATPSPAGTPPEEAGDSD